MAGGVGTVHGGRRGRGFEHQAVSKIMLYHDITTVYSGHALLGSPSLHSHASVHTHTHT